MSTFTLPENPGDDVPPLGHFYRRSSALCPPPLRVLLAVLVAPEPEDLQAPGVVFCCHGYHFLDRPIGCLVLHPLPIYSDDSVTN